MHSFPTPPRSFGRVITFKKTSHRSFSNHNFGPARATKRRWARRKLALRKEWLCQEAAYMYQHEKEGFGRRHYERGDMADLGFDVVKHNPDDALKAAMEVFKEPGGDNTLTLFADASLNKELQPLAGVGVVRVDQREDSDGVSLGKNGKRKAYKLRAVASQKLTDASRGDNCPSPAPRFTSTEGEL